MTPCRCSPGPCLGVLPTHIYRYPYYNPYIYFRLNISLPDMTPTLHFYDGLYQRVDSLVYTCTTCTLHVCKLYGLTPGSHGTHQTRQEGCRGLGRLRNLLTTHGHVHAYCCWTVPWLTTFVVLIWRGTSLHETADTAQKLLLWTASLHATDSSSYFFFVYTVNTSCYGAMVFLSTALGGTQWGHTGSRKTLFDAWVTSG